MEGGEGHPTPEHPFDQQRRIAAQSHHDYYVKRNLWGLINPRNEVDQVNFKLALDREKEGKVQPYKETEVQELRRKFLMFLRLHKLIVAYEWLLYCFRWRRWRN